MRTEINKALRSLPYYLFLPAAILLLAFVLFQPSALTYPGAWSDLAGLIEICFFLWCLRQVARALWFIFREHRRMS